MIIFDGSNDLDSYITECNMLLAWKPMIGRTFYGHAQFKYRPFSFPCPATAPPTQETLTSKSTTHLKNRSVAYFGPSAIGEMLFLSCNFVLLSILKRAKLTFSGLKIEMRSKGTEKVRIKRLKVRGILWNNY